MLGSARTKKSKNIIRMFMEDDNHFIMLKDEFKDKKHHFLMKEISPQ